MDVRKKAVNTFAMFGMASLLLLPQLAISDGGKTYRVTISNLTSGQPFTPPVLLTHTGDTGIFSLGEEASTEIQAIAENGNNVPLVTVFSGDVDVREIVVGTAPIVPAHNPGGTPFESSASFMISTSGKAKFLSIASMLICTNDGFTGIDSVRLPSKTKTVYAVAYDARTEQNTEDFADIVPPCQGLIGVSSTDMGTGMTDALLFQEGVVIPHAGINGGDDLQPQVHGWGDPVAKIVIERMRNDDDD